MSNPIRRFVEWIRLGYPTGIPVKDHNAVIALLRRQLTDDEVDSVCRELAQEHLVPLDTADVGVGVMRTTNEVPSPADMDRVRGLLETKGWPVVDVFPERRGAGPDGTING